VSPLYLFKFYFLFIKNVPQVRREKKRYLKSNSFSLVLCPKKIILIAWCVGSTHRRHERGEEENFVSTAENMVCILVHNWFCETPQNINCDGYFFCPLPLMPRLTVTDIFNLPWQPEVPVMVNRLTVTGKLKGPSWKMGEAQQAHSWPDSRLRINLGC
jgi:hypothetical protein